ncbi:MAG TPA: AAA family ATPase [Nitrososphaeraceae archaeon]|nr:AAA family ATPase [Nitrososphaeraceae archaeon]
MEGNFIFKDRTKLSPRYIPKELPHREKQIDLLKRIFSNLKNDPDKYPLTILQIIGQAGIGKTSTLIRFGNLLKEELANNKINSKIVCINLKLQGGNKYAIYKYMLGCIAPELPAQGLSAEEMLRQMIDYLDNTSSYALIILDEIDYLIKISKDIGIIYDLTRLNEFNPNKRCNVKGVIFIARSTEFYEKLDEAELSSLGRVPIEFPTYTIEQVSDILVQRSVEAFHKEVISTDIIDWISRIIISSEINGDIRYALDLLTYAGNIAENEGTKKILLDQVKRVHEQIYKGITDEDIKDLSKEQIVILLAIIRGLRIKKKDYVELKEIRMQVLDISEENKIKKLDVEDILTELDTKKIIRIHSLKKISLLSASIDKLEKILEDIINGKKS